MQIRIKPPNPAEAEWKFDSKTGELIIDVFFYGTQRSQSVGYVETVGQQARRIAGCCVLAALMGVCRIVMPVVRRYLVSLINSRCLNDG